MDDTDIVRMASSLVWLEDQQQAAQGSLVKLQQQLDQLSAFVAEYGLALRDHGAEVGRLKSQMNRLPGLEQSTRQLQERIAKLDDEQSSFTAHLDRLERGQQTDSKRLSQAVVEVRQLFEPIASDVEVLPARISLLADGLKRQQDALAELHQGVESQVTEYRSMSGRLQGALDQLRRTEQETARLGGELEPLRQQDDALLARIQSMHEHIKQIADQSAICQELDHLYRDLLDRSQLQKAEHQSLESEVARISQVLLEHGERLDGMVRAVKASDEKSRQTVDALVALQKETSARFERVLCVIGDHQQLVLEQKERQVAELERQLRELRETATWKEAK